MNWKQGFGEIYWEIVDSETKTVIITYRSKKKAEEFLALGKPHNPNLIMQEVRI